MKKIELKEICGDVEITLNNLRDCVIEESDGSVYVVFGEKGVSVRDSPESDSGESESDEE
ncbi:MAG TPA: hypothetical protein VMM38_05485 [Aridibacter sp.]|nr:hypothetical protein [Aridibacter sp.]